MARKKNKRTGNGTGENRPRRGQRRSIRFDADEDWDRDQRRTSDPAAPPTIMLRKLTVDEALQRLEAQLPAWAGKGTRELLLIHGKGQNSPGGLSVLGPAVRQWCDDHPDVISSWREAPPRWGGSGAIVVLLRQTD